MIITCLEGVSSASAPRFTLYKSRTLLNRSVTSKNRIKEGQMAAGVKVQGKNALKQAPVRRLKPYKAIQKLIIYKK